MLRVQIVPCTLPNAEADALNQESGRVYTNTPVWRDRIYRRTGHWLSANAAGRLEDALGGPTLLHAHSRAAAQHGFSAACTVARAQRRRGLGSHYPHRHKSYRTTNWKQTGMRLHDRAGARAGEREDGMVGVLLLARARGLEPVRAALSPPLQGLPAEAYKQVELIWERAARTYE